MGNKFSCCYNQAIGLQNDSNNLKSKKNLKLESSNNNIKPALLKNQLFLGNDYGWLKSIHLKTNRMYRNYGLFMDGPIKSMVMSKDKQHIFIINYLNQLVLWHIKSEKIIKNYGESIRYDVQTLIPTNSNKYIFFYCYSRKLVRFNQYYHTPAYEARHQNSKSFLLNKKFVNQQQFFDSIDIVAIVSTKDGKLLWLAFKKRPNVDDIRVAPLQDRFQNIGLEEHAVTNPWNGRPEEFEVVNILQYDIQTQKKRAVTWNVTDKETQFMDISSDEKYLLILDNKGVLLKYNVLKQNEIYLESRNSLFGNLRLDDYGIFVNSAHFITEANCSTVFLSCRYEYFRGGDFEEGHLLEFDWAKRKLVKKYGQICNKYGDYYNIKNTSITHYIFSNKS